MPAKPVIYLDHNSTTPIDPRVIAAMSESYQAGYVNPASQHRPGQLARQVLEDMRENLLKSLGGCATGMQTDQLVFTSGGTESNNLAVSGIVAERRQKSGTPGRILISAIEHPSVIGAAESLRFGGTVVQQIAVNADGVIRLDDLREAIEQHGPEIHCVCIMLANNETGVIQPVREAAEICRAADIPLHCDAVQAVAKIDVGFTELGVDSLALTAHKFHGPRGIGGLITRHGLVVHPVMYGGFQQMAVRPGTEDVALATGLNAAMEIFRSEGSTNAARMAQLRDSLETRILESVQGAIVNGSGADRVPHTSNLSFPDIDRQEFLMAADLENLAVSTGSACASGSSEPSHVISAMASDPGRIGGSIRISLGLQTTAAEIDLAAERIINICKRLRR